MTEPRPRCTDRCYRMTDRGLCDWCTRRAGDEVTDLRGLWPALHDALMPAAGHGDGRGSGEPSLGCSADVLSFLGPAGDVSADAEAERGVVVHGDDQRGVPPLLDTLRGWARLAAEERNFAQTDWSFAGTRDFLARNHEWICRQMWADDYAAELHQAWRMAMTLTGRWESPQHLDGRYCPWCNGNSLYRSPGEDAIECQRKAGGCGRRMTEEDYDRMCRMRRSYVEANQHQAADGTRWLWSPEFQVWNGWHPDEDGTWELSPAEMLDSYPEIAEREDAKAPTAVVG